MSKHLPAAVRMLVKRIVDTSGEIAEARLVNDHRFSAEYLSDLEAAVEHLETVYIKHWKTAPQDAVGDSV